MFMQEFTPKGKALRKSAILAVLKAFFLLIVIPLGFEPRTHTLKVYCSTN